jgi:MFS transporter, FSR family, fosmidomycin resistance protein
MPRTGSNSGGEEALTLQAGLSSPRAVKMASPLLLGVVTTLSFSHFLNDLLQSLLQALYPLLKLHLELSYTQIGLLTLGFQLTASLLQPWVGFIGDRRPLIYALPFGMGVSLAGVILLAVSHTFWSLFLGAVAIGLGSAIFHPEASRLVRRAAGSQPGLAQSLLQLGGNFGTALGPIAALTLIGQHHQERVAWFSLAALCAIFLLLRAAHWYQHSLRVANPVFVLSKNVPKNLEAPTYKLPETLLKPRLSLLCLLLVLVFSKYFYTAIFGNYYNFFLMEKFSISLKQAQIYLFFFLLANAVGAIIGGHLGDKIGRRQVIWGSIIGPLPFILCLPYVNLFGVISLSLLIGFIMASAFSAIVIYAQEIFPRHIGLVSGLFFGFAFGIAAIGAAVFGLIADYYGIERLYQLAAFIPLLGLSALKLPAKPPSSY